jgi:hypothetical protein
LLTAAFALQVTIAQAQKNVFLPLAFGGDAIQQATPTPLAETEPLLATFTGVEYDSDGVRVSFRWLDEPRLPDSAQLFVRNDQGETIGKHDLRPATGEMGMTTIARDPLDLGVLKSGTHTEVSIESGAGRSLAQYGFDWTLNCDLGEEAPEGGCAWTVIEDTHRGDGINLSAELASALREISGADDREPVSDAIEKRHPELRGEMMMASVELTRRRALIGAQAPCLCTWGYWFSRNPSVPVNLFSKVKGDFLWNDGYNGRGAVHRILSHYDKVKAQVWSNGSSNNTGSGTSQMGLVDLCLRFIKHVSTDVLIVPPPPAQPYLQHIEYDVYAYCDSACTITFDHIGRYAGELQAGLWAKPNNTSKATEAGTYRINGGSVMSIGPFVLDVGTGNGNVGTQTLPFNQPYSTSMVLPGPVNCCQWFESELTTSGYTKVRGKARHSNEGLVKTSFLFATHAAATDCGPGPDGVVWPPQAVQWDYDGYLGQANLNTIRNEIKAYFWNNWLIPTNP